LGKEDEYFLELEAKKRAELRAELEAKANASAERRKVADEVGIDDEQLAERIRSLGFEGDTARVLHLMPLVEVAWADGSLSPNERHVILQAADAHGIKPGSQGAVLLASMLEQRPSDTVLEEILEVLMKLLHAKDLHPGDVLEACVDVAQASGGFLGLGDKVSSEERAMIEKIAASFGESAKEQVAKRLT
jgi:tellurite resistance protein